MEFPVEAGHLDYSDSDGSSWTFDFYDNDNDFKVDLSMVSRNKNFEYCKTVQESAILKNVDLSYELEIE